MAGVFEGDKLGTLRQRVFAPPATMPLLRAALRVLGHTDAYSWSAARSLLFGGIAAAVDAESFNGFDAAAEGALPLEVAKYAKFVCKGVDEDALAKESPLGMPLLWFLRVVRSYAAAADTAREGRAQDAELAAAKAAEAAEAAEADEGAEPAAEAAAEE